MKNFLRIMLCFTLVFLSGCDDEVEVKPDGLDADDFFNNQEEYEGALIGAYDLLQATFWTVLSDIVASDDYRSGGDPSTYDQATVQNIDQMVQTQADENQLRDIWNLMYAGLNRVNYILEFKNKTDFEGRDEIIAEAYFLRAYYTFELVKHFGNIPLKTEDRNGVLRIRDDRIKTGDEFSLERIDDISTAYGVIEEDLLEAIPNLPVVQDLPYEATKGAAQALLGKVYLYHGTYDQSKFSDAANVLNQVIQSNQYALVTGEDYSSLFDSSGENGPESVFEIQYTGIEGAGWDCIICSEGSYFVQFCGPRSLSDETYDSGWGFCLPSSALFDMFDENDIRREVTFLDLRLLQDSYSPSRFDEGFFNKKYLPRKEDERVGPNPLNHANNYRAIRYADVLLLAAEAEAQTGGANAEDYLNLVRARAYGDNSNDYSASEGDLLQAIYTERRKELAGEGHRYFDIVRTGQATSAFNAYNAYIDSEGLFMDDEFRLIQYREATNGLFPIPLIELELAQAIERWGQNPGY